MPVIVALGTVVLIVFMLWFAVGTQRNISRGNDVLRWLQEGLGQLGARTTVQWRGSSAVQLDLVEPKEPFAEAQVVVVLEPRDLAWLWAWSHRRGRRDFVILRGTLPEAPRFELEAGSDRGWTGRERLRGLERSPDAEAIGPARQRWATTTWDDPAGPVEVAHSDEADGAVLAAERTWREVARAAGPVWRLSVRRDAPHVEVHVESPALHAQHREQGDAERSEALIGAFRQLARLAGGTAGSGD